jgi:two-component system nitrogen regulation response regulator NtrX
VNSAAIPRELVESEMFGHERGAFTGATERTRGRFELAHTGTLFLDEVGDLGGEAQAKLLRALESGSIQRIGGAEAFTVDVRVLAATHHDLHADVELGRFREDLLFRLDVVPLRIPPLRDRLDDIHPLVKHIRDRLRHRQGLQVPELTEAGIAILRRHSWPGNVRELINVLERLAILYPGATATAETVQASIHSSTGPPRTLAASLQDDRPLADRLDAFERVLLSQALEATRGNVAEAARLLQTDRANLYRRLRRLGLRQED